MTTRKPLRYHLRFQIIPGPRVERDARTLVRFCKAHGVEEVVLFFAGEEWNNGLLTPREENRWFDAIARAKPILDRAGIVCSLNPWMTVLHCDRGRRMPAALGFAPLVSPAGETSLACASFADARWQKYIRRLYGRFAALGFRVIWVEDDFRFHNHGPLTWGGGFEPEVIARFEKKIGRKAGREEIVRNILKPGAPHPWRAAWMETWRELHLEVASGLTRAVAARSPVPVSLGLMSSHPSKHSIEGRDWQRLFAAFSVDHRVAHRPHYAGYSESTGGALAYSFMMLDLQRQFRPAQTEVAPEVENFPFTNWTKSDSLTWAQMAAALLHGSDALLLDLFPFAGNPADREPAIGALLDRSRPGLEWIAARFGKELRTGGVGLPWKEDAAAQVRTAAGLTLNELHASSFDPGNLLLPLGVPVSAQRQKVNAVFGALAWAFSNSEWRELLSGGLFLDAATAEILCRRGFGGDIGVDFVRWLHREEDNYSVEEVVAAGAGVPKGHFFNANLVDRVAVLKPRRGAVPWTRLLTPERRPVGPMTVAFRNARGGRVFTFAVPNPGQLPMSDARQGYVQRAVRFLAGGRLDAFLVTGGPHLLPIHFRAGAREVRVVFNGSPDPAQPVLHLPGGTRRPNTTLLAPLAGPRAVRLRRLRGNTWALSGAAVPHLGYLVVTEEA